jgi:hypothetical protein
MPADNLAKKAVHDLCGDALAACKSLDIALIGMQSRLDLDMPVEATMVIIEADLLILGERVKALRGNVVVSTPQEDYDEPR